MIRIEKERKTIDEIDNQILCLIKQRENIVKKIGELKTEYDIPIMQNERIEKIMEQCYDFALKNNIEYDYLKQLYNLIINHSCKKEEEIKKVEKRDRKIKVCTLGPEGTCHENATKNYMCFQGLKDNYEILYVTDFVEAVKLIREGSVDIIVQNCAHPQVGLLNEKYRTEIFMIDSFIFPTKSMGVIKRKNVVNNNSIGLMPATINYIDLKKWDSIFYESSNPLVEKGLIEGKYEYGITFTDAVERNKDLLEMVEEFGGPIDTSWIVYGRKRKNIYGEVLGTKIYDYLMKEY